MSVPPKPSSPPEWPERLAYLTDSAFRIPGTSFRIGWDGILGLIPGVGDFLGSLLGLAILVEGKRRGCSLFALLKMAINLGADFILGLAPVAGDLLDFAWKANRRNLRIMERNTSDRRT